MARTKPYEQFPEFAPGARGEPPAAITAAELERVLRKHRAQDRRRQSAGALFMLFVVVPVGVLMVFAILLGVGFVLRQIEP